MPWRSFNPVPSGRQRCCSKRSLRVFGRVLQLAADSTACHVGGIPLLHHLWEGVFPWSPLSLSPRWCGLPWCGRASCFMGHGPATPLHARRRRSRNPHCQSASASRNAGRFSPASHTVTPATTSPPPRTCFWTSPVVPRPHVLRVYGAAAPHGSARQSASAPSPARGPDGSDAVPLSRCLGAPRSAPSPGSPPLWAGAPARGRRVPPPGRPAPTRSDTARTGSSRRPHSRNAHIPSDYVVTSRFSHHTLDLSMRDPHDVLSTFHRI
jgi:hypothetical protein